MDRKKIISELARLRREVEKPEPDLHDVMARLDDIERRLAGIEVRGVPVPYPVYPYQRWDPHPYWQTTWCQSLGTNTTSTSGAITVSNIPGVQ